jgi:hypothetical protein
LGGHDSAGQAVLLDRYSTGLSPLQSELDALVVVVMHGVMHAHFERIHAIGPFEMEVLGFQGAEEAFNRRIVEQLPLRLMLCSTPRRTSVAR